MKYGECNARQKKAWKNIKYAATSIIFETMNGCLDSAPGDEYYDSCLATLKDLEGLKTTVYEAATSCIYGEGYCHFGPGAESFLRDIRFCGKEFLMDIVTKYCVKYQAEALDELGESI